MKWCSQHSLWFLAFSFRLQFFLPKQHFSDVYIFWYYHLWCSVTWSLGTFFEEYWFPGWLSNGLHHCACVPLLFLRFLIVLFLCSIYQKPNTLLKYKTTSTKYNLFPSMCVPQLLFQFWIVPCVPFIFLFLFSYFADSSILPNQTTDVFPIPIVVSPPPLIYPQRHCQ